MEYILQHSNVFVIYQSLSDIEKSESYRVTLLFFQQHCVKEPCCFNRNTEKSVVSNITFQLGHIIKPQGALFVTYRKYIGL